MRRWTVPTLALLMGAVFLAGCARCGASAPKRTLSLYEVLPKQAQAVVAIPDAGILGGKLTRLQRLKLAGFAAQLQGFSSADDLVTAVMAGLGVDVRSAKSMLEVGLAPQRGWGLVLLDGQKSYAVAGVQDEKRFLETLATLAQNRLGAGERSTQSQKGLSLTTFRGPHAAAELSVIFANGFAFLGTRLSADELRAAAGLAADASLAKDDLFTRSLGDCPRTRTWWPMLPWEAHLPGGPRRKARHSPCPWTTRGFRLRGTFPVPPTTPLTG